MTQRDLDACVYTEAAILESLRLAQQSITLRKALTNVTLASERGDIFVPKGTYIGTLLSVTNTDNETLRYRQQRHQQRHGGETGKSAPLATFDPRRYLNEDQSKVCCLTVCMQMLIESR